MATHFINFSAQPITEPAKYRFWWNEKKPQPLTPVEQPLTPQQREQNLAIIKELTALPKIVGIPLRKRYEEKLKNDGLKKAHDFLFFDVHEKLLPRIHAVTQRYSANPLFCGEQFNNLPNLYEKGTKKLSGKLADAFFMLFEEACEQITKHSTGDDNEIYTAKNMLPVYKKLADLARDFHITPLYYQRFRKRRLTLQNIFSSLSRLTNEDYWYRRLKAHRARWRESLLIAMMVVNTNASPYASRQAIREVRSQKEANKRYLESMELEDIETGDRHNLIDSVMKSISNPEIRRMELMAQIAGIEKLALERQDIGMFITLTTPSKYHPTKIIRRGKKDFAFINKNWGASAYTPKDGQNYLVKVWARIRTRLKDEKLDVYGIRTVEPHHDGTPHWHMLLFTTKAQRAAVIDIMREEALKEDGEEQGAQKRRFTCKHMNKGGATAYMAKYVSKNIDGYALDNELDDETNRPLQERVDAVASWASLWRIRQFQFYNLPTKGAYRECRRLRSKSVAHELGDIAEKVRAAADEGDFYSYLISQGGPCTPRKEQTVRVARRLLNETNQYNEEIREVVGICAPLFSHSTVKTREKKFRIVKKEQEQNTATTPSDKGVNLLKSAIGATRSAVNNCGNVNLNSYENAVKNRDFNDQESEFIIKQAQALNLTPWHLMNYRGLRDELGRDYEKEN